MTSASMSQLPRFGLTSVIQSRMRLPTLHADYVMVFCSCWISLLVAEFRPPVSLEQLAKLGSKLHSHDHCISANAVQLQHGVALVQTFATSICTLLAIPLHPLIS